MLVAHSWSPGCLFFRGNRPELICGEISVAAITFYLSNCSLKYKDNVCAEWRPADSFRLLHGDRELSE